MQLSHAKLVPVPAGQGSNCSTWSWSPSGPDGRSLRGGGPVVPRVPGAQQGLRGGGLGGAGIPVVHGSGMAREAGILPCMGLARGCGLAQPEGQRAWQNGAVALQTYVAGIRQASCSFIRLWRGEAFHNLSV
jgi:hypothetical protein